MNDIVLIDFVFISLCVEMSVCLFVCLLCVHVYEFKLSFNSVVSFGRDDVDHVCPRQFQ